MNIRHRVLSLSLLFLFLYLRYVIIVTSSLAQQNADRNVTLTNIISYRHGNILYLMNIRQQTFSSAQMQSLLMNLRLMLVAISHLVGGDGASVFC